MPELTGCQYARRNVPVKRLIAHHLSDEYPWALGIIVTSKTVTILKLRPLVLL